MIALPKPAPVAPFWLVTCLNRWLLDQGGKSYMGDAAVLTQSQWRARGNAYGNDATATMVIDGSVLFSSFNYGDPPEPALELTRLTRKLGYYIELGYAWSLHFYPDGGT